MDGLKGKVAVVTGGAKGIGRACTLALGREGASVVFADIDRAANQELLAMAGDEGLAIQAVAADVADSREAARVVGSCRSNLWGSRHPGQQRRDPAAQFLRECRGHPGGTLGSDH